MYTYLRYSTAVALVCAALAVASPAALITYEGFNYSAAPVDGQTGGTGWDSAGWDTQSDNTGYAVNSASPLSFGGLVTSGGYLNGGGSFTNTGRRVLANFTSDWNSAGRVSSPFSDQNLDQGVVWASMLVRVNAPITSWDNARVWFHDQNVPWAPGGSADTNGLQIRSNGGAAWGVGEGQSGGLTSTGVGVTVGTTYLFVAKFELSLTAGANNAYVWIFDNPGAVGLGGADLATGTAVGSITGRNSEDLRFKSIGFYLDNANDRVSVDEIRLGTTFADVTPVPEPSSFALLAAGLGVLTWLRRRGAARRMAAA